MRERIRQLMSRLSLFWRYFFLLATVAFVFVVAFTVATHQFTGTLRNSYLEQAQNGFEKNAELFARDLSLIHSLPMAVEDTEYYFEVAHRSAQQESRYVFYLAEFSNSFGLQCLLLDLPSEGFVYFRDSQACVTRRRIFSDVSNCFESYLIYNNNTPLLELMHGGELSIASRLLPAEAVSVGGRTDTYLTVLVQSAGKEAVYGFLYPVESLLDYFQIDHLPEDTRFELTRMDGTVLYSYGGEGERADDIRLTCELPALSSMASISIPGAYFKATVNRSQTAAQIIFLLSVVVGIALCFLFSHISTKPFRQLIRSHTVDTHTPVNELIAIDSVLKNAREKTMALSGMLMSSLLVRAFSGLTIPEEEYRKISAAFPAFATSLRVAIVRDRSAQSDGEEDNTGINQLRKALPEEFLCEYVNLQETVILFPAETMLCEQLQEVVQELNAGAERDVRFVCGVSEPFTGAENISQAIRQAQFCLPEDGERVLVQMPQEDEQVSAAEAVDLMQLQQALACWNRQEALAQIEQIAAVVGRNSAVRPQEPFYSALFLLRDSAHSARLSFEEYEHMTYQPTSSPVANLRRLKGVVNDLFEQKAAVQMTDKQVLCEEIVQYVKNNYPDPDLCMASLAKQFYVSERFVFNAVQDSTGMNVSSLLLQCRMQEAARLLRDTQENVGTIAQKCGYPVESTFYRNFKKYYHMTPAEYKSAR